MIYPITLSLHLLSATVWTGGHLVLLLGFLPKILKNRDLVLLQTYEQHFEKIGIPSLIIQVISGIILAYHRQPDILLWISDSNIFLKLILLVFTIGLALHARLFIISKLNEKNLTLLALHIIAITLTAVTFVLTGLNFRLSLF